MIARAQHNNNKREKVAIRLPEKSALVKSARVGEVSL